MDIGKVHAGSVVPCLDQSGPRQDKASECSQPFFNLASHAYGLMKALAGSVPCHLWLAFLFDWSASWLLTRLCAFSNLHDDSLGFIELQSVLYTVYLSISPWSYGIIFGCCNEADSFWEPCVAAGQESCTSCSSYGEWNWKIHMVIAAYPRAVSVACNQ
eukprot:5385835-Amphidinium_carterae.2